MAFRFAAAGLVGLLTAKRKVSLVLGTAQGDALFALHDRRPQRIRAQLTPSIAAYTGTGPAAPAGQ